MRKKYTFLPAAISWLLPVTIINTVEHKSMFPSTHDENTVF
jgi:hypothetical protein